MYIIITERAVGISLWELDVINAKIQACIKSVANRAMKSYLGWENWVKSSF